MYNETKDIDICENADQAILWLMVKKVCNIHNKDPVGYRNTIQA